ncbi:MAG: imidazole glycerol phosphate synthase subunit HisH [Candidatus Omnitrophica bacterium]|nr:imidazole glycerol phosphate synthase subunit HisH [Candidatus Omnitrophota bacterium]
MIAIVDYGMGNLASVRKACAFLGVPATVTSDPGRLARARGLIFPGVGAFGAAMRELKKQRLLAPIVGSVKEGKPFLGLCLGLQLLFEASDEAPGVKGLGLLPGRVRRLPRRKGLKVPHMGWNQIKAVKSEELRVNPLLKSVPDGAFMYFVHSYAADPEERDVVSAETDYGGRFPSVLWNGGRLWATQFHPEKSQKWGLKILENFLKVNS